MSREQLINESQKKIIVPKWLYEVELSDGTLYFVKGKKEITWNGNIYLPAAVQHSNIKTAKDKNIENLTLTLNDVRGDLTRSILDNEIEGIPVIVRLIFLRFNQLTGIYDVFDDTSCFSFKYKIYSYDILVASNIQSIKLNLNSFFNINNLTLPGRTYLREFCSWIYKSPECGYTGDNENCDYTLDGENGCKAHNNELRFGGFPGISGSRIQVV